MKLSLKMIAERLEHQVRILKFKDIYSTIRLDKPVFLTDETQLKANTLYISTAERLPDNLTYQDGCALIVPGDIFTDLRSCPALILINDKEDIFRVHNLVCQIFDLFQNWERSLKYTYVHYSRMKALETLLNASVEIFENPLVLSDISFEILASAFPGGSAKASADRQRRSSAAKAAADRQSNPSAVRRKDASVNEPVNAAEGKRDDISVIGLFGASANRQDKALADHPAFRSHRKSHEVYVAVDGSLPCRLMTRNIFSGQTLFYHLIIAEICRPFRETDYLLLEFLAGYLEKIVRKDSGVPIFDNTTLAGILTDGIGSDLWNRPLLEKELSKIKWNIGDDYQLLYMTSAGHNLLHDSITYYCSEINRQSGYVFAFGWGGSVTILMNLTGLKAASGEDHDPKDSAVSDADTASTELHTEKNPEAGTADAVEAGVSVHPDASTQLRTEKNPEMSTADAVEAVASAEAASVDPGAEGTRAGQHQKFHYEDPGTENAEAGQHQRTRYSDNPALLRDFLEKHSLRAGISNPFHGICGARRFYRQAVVACRIGYRDHPSETLSLFSDTVLTYLLDCASSEFDQEDLLSPIYIRLRDYDLQNNTEYLKTLRVYMNQHMNAVQTAATLYIHRATLIYRLKRICEIGRTDLKKTDELLHLSLSFRMIDQPVIPQ